MWSHLRNFTKGKPQVKQILFMFLNSLRFALLRRLGFHQRDSHQSQALIPFHHHQAAAKHRILETKTGRRAVPASKLHTPSAHNSVQPNKERRTEYNMPPKNKEKINLQGCQQLPKLTCWHEMQKKNGKEKNPTNMSLSYQLQVTNMFHKQQSTKENPFLQPKHNLKTTHLWAYRPLFWRKKQKEKAPTNKPCTLCHHRLEFPFRATKIKLPWKKNSTHHLGRSSTIIIHRRQD